MKRIYIIVLDNDIINDKKMSEKIKLLCYMVYESIREMQEVVAKKIILTDGIIYDALLEKYSNNGYKYEFYCNDYIDGKYEPFMIDDMSFGFTINDGTLSYDDILEVVNENKNIVCPNYNFKISSLTYEDDKKHKHRKSLIKRIYHHKAV